MKKIIIISFIITHIAFSNFIEDIRIIDAHIQNKEYEIALEKSKNILENKLNKLSPDEIMTLNAIINEINDKIDSNNVVSNIINNIGISNILNTDESLASFSNGTLPVSSSENIADKTKFEKYDEFEKQILQTENSEAINQLALLYIKENLYEKAMKLALKDKTRNIKNIYLAATTARMIGKFDQSINLYSEILKQNSAHSKSLLGMSIAYKSKGNFREALRYLKSYSAYDSSPRILDEIRALESK